MRRDADRQKMFGRRAALLAGGKLALLSALAGRMYYLQVIESERYATLAEENRINLRLLPPPRGRILDRFGRPLAVNQQNYQVILISEQTRDPQATLEAFSAIIPLSAAEHRRILREVYRKRSFVPVTVRENLTWEEVARIEVNAPDLPGMMIDVGQSRDYPHAEETAHVLGYVAAVSESEITGDPLLQLPGFRVGKAGIEKTHDMLLRGTGGVSQVEVNALGRVNRELSRRDGQPGAQVKTTLDVQLQELVSNRLTGESAAAVVLDVATGDVLAMASIPSFDPKAFNRGLTGEEWRALTSNARRPLVNKAIAGQYAPGSTFKIAVALAALENRTMAPTTRVFCSGKIQLGNATFHCWKKGGHGWVDMIDGITKSCDVYFYEVARRTGVDRISAMAEQLGLGRNLGVDLPGEQPGLLPTRDWKMATMGTPWQLGETLIYGIGQGYVLATPLQLATMLARTVNGGRAVVPRLTDEVRWRGRDLAPPRRPVSELDISPASLRLVREGLAGVVNNPHGTAYLARIREPGLEMGGKSGTSQVRRITKAERETGLRRNEDLPWEVRDHALFLAYAPLDAPRFAVAVVIEHGGGGSRAAAPIARDILLAAQRWERERPAPPPPGTREAGTDGSPAAGAG